MVQITFHPGSAGARTIALKEGDNTVGRAEDNDIPVPEDGVSGYHCRITVSGGTVSITDLNSTNGTHCDGSRIHQSAWAPGQILHLGTTPVRLETTAVNGAETRGTTPAGPEATPSATPSAAPIRVTPVPRTAGPGPMQVRLRVSGHAPTAADPAAEAPAAEAPAAEAPVAEAEAVEAPGTATSAFVTAPPGTHCRSHTHSLASWTCPQCRKYFCDLCVSTRVTSAGTSHACRGCGVECTQVYVEASADPGERGFFARLPGAFLFPFRGAGVLMLIIATVIFEGSSMLAGLFAILLKMMITGYLFVFLQDIIHGAAAGEEKIPGMPEFDGLFGAFFKLLGTFAISFIIPIGLAIAKFSDVDIPPSAFVASILVSLLYFPMAFLAVAIMDSVAAANPMLVVPSIVRVPGQYVVSVLVLCAVYGVQRLGDSLAQGAAETTFTTTEMSVLLMSLAVRALWSFLSVYLLVVASRVLGLLYVTQREKLGWL